MVKNIYISVLDQKLIRSLMNNKNLGEDFRYSIDIEFNNGFKGYIDICGVDNDFPYTQMVLYNEMGFEIGFTEPEYDFDGEYCVEYDNEIYIINVIFE